MSKNITGLVIFGLVLVGWYLGVFYAPTDASQGQVYRILYVHVPVVFSAFIMSMLLFVFSIWGLKTYNEKSLHWAKATAEVGFLLTLLTLATGSIWGRPTWGVWWTWDARLTTTLILALLYGGYLMLYSSLDQGKTRIKTCAALGLLIFIDLPIIYKSVKWWRTIHQDSDLIDNRGANMSSDMLSILIFNIIVMLCLAFYLMYNRTKLIAQREELEQESLLV